LRNTSARNRRSPISSTTPQMRERRLSSESGKPYVRHLISSCFSLHNIQYSSELLLCLILFYSKVFNCQHFLLMKSLYRWTYFLVLKSHHQWTYFLVLKSLQLWIYFLMLSGCGGGCQGRRTEGDGGGGGIQAPLEQHLGRAGETTPAEPPDMPVQL